MSTTSPAGRPKRRSWLDYARAFGRAHQRAKVQLDSSMPLLEHLEELRQRLFKAFAALVVATALSFIFAGRLVDFLAAPIGGRKALVSIEVTENVAIFMRVSMLSGVVLAMPVIVYQIMAFVLPGLTNREKRWLILGVPFASLLFISGVAFTWYVMLPAAIPFLINFLGITTQVRPNNYFEFATSIMFWIGLSFEMPLIVFFLAMLKLVKASQLIRYWRHAIVVMAIVAAVVTPTIDPINMSLVMLPLGGLYAISIVLAAIAGRG
jgi:sec-independent protein translocase protein TatC